MKPTAEKFGGIGNEAVEAKTGKNWQQWFGILDKQKAGGLSHKQIAELVHEKYKMTAWWSQMITVGYEQARGLRVKNQNSLGEFRVDVSKVVETSLEKLYKAVAEEAERKDWLKSKLEVRLANKNKNLRANFKGKSANLLFAFSKKGETKCQIVVTESKLADKQEVEKQRVYWKSALTKLQTLLA